MSSRYDTDHIAEAQFEPGSRGRVLKNLIGIRSKCAMDELEATKLADATDWAIRLLPLTSVYLPVAQAMAG